MYLLWNVLIYRHLSQDTWLEDQDSGFRIQEESYQSFSNDQAIDTWLRRIRKIYLQTAISQGEL